MSHFERANTALKMLLASWTFITILNGSRSFNTENLGSVGQMSAKLPAINLWEWFDNVQTWIRAYWFEWGPGQVADSFLRPPTLTAGNVVAHWPTDPKFSVLKDLNFLKKHTKSQEASSILKVVFALSKWPHLHRAYLVTCNIAPAPAQCFVSNLKKSQNTFLGPLEWRNLFRPSNKVSSYEKLT